ncbi:enhancer of polycomb homolog 1-like isoform X2 [Acanthaster planci]|uniref:Enhancer of polycomb-like protein n=1 Tax=Acanthaster planci TaxID=133434 RepID=A0A8B7Y5E9_ACAPL|nr:enhancer of polycomb homolog 1-like isoform X2 [Acanthaster planci]
MSKLSFRARALDASKPMPVYMTEELPDLPDFSAINRAVPQMPTGMEKEEESEHHLQRAISAQQVYGSANPLVIPTPDFETSVSYYEELYDPSYKQPKQYVHVQPLSMEQDIPDYDMDADDEEWMRKHRKTFEITELQFEEMMDRLEKGSGQRVVTLKEAKLLLKEDDDLIIAVYDYWLNKRLKSMTGCGLIPSVRQEKRDGSTSNNPYVAFRRRTEKMQTRKNRKNDEASYEKMLKLRRDLNRAVTLLEMVKRREKSKKEAVHLTLEIFEKRYQMEDFSGTILAECEELSKRQPSFTIPAIPNGNQYAPWSMKTEDGLKKKREYKKRKHKDEKKLRQTSVSSLGEIEPARFPDIRSSEEELSPQVQSISDHEEEADPDGIFAFRRKKGCHYVAPHSDLVQGWPWSADPPRGVTDNRYRYCCTSLREPRRCVGLARRRVGRGGRILLDRAWSPFQDFKRLDDALSSPSDPLVSPLRSASASSSQTSLPLSFLLEEIRAKRMLHYRPKTPPPAPQQPSATSPSPTLPQSQVLMENSLDSFLQPSRTIPAIQTPSKLPQQMLMESDSTVDSDAAGPSASQQTLPSLVSGPEPDAVAPLLDSQDLQTLEVDVVNSDSSSELNTSFGSLPTSRFTLEPSRELSKTKSAVVEQLPVLVSPSSVVGVKENHSSSAANALLNHKAVIEASTKVPIGHSTAPAATVLQLNYPLGTTKITTPSTTTPSTTMPIVSTSASVNAMDGVVVTNSVDVVSPSMLDVGTGSDALRKGSLDRQRTRLNLDGTSVVPSTAQNVSLANAVKRMSQANNIDVISRDKHEDSNHSLDGNACIPNNKSVVMEVT